MSEFDFSFRPGALPGEGGSAVGVRELITRAERLIDTPRPADGYPLAWHVEALAVGDVSAIGMAAARAAQAASGRPAAR